MNSQNAELALSEGAAEIAAPLPGSGARAAGRRRSGLRAGSLLPAEVLRARMRLRARAHAPRRSGSASAVSEHRLAVRESARALLGSRALIWAAVAAVVLAFGF